MYGEVRRQLSWPDPNSRITEKCIPWLTLVWYEAKCTRTFCVVLLMNGASVESKKSRVLPVTVLLIVIVAQCHSKKSQ